MPPVTTLSAAAPSGAMRAEIGATLRLAVPLAAANLLQMLVFAIDVIFVARLGPEALAAASLATTVFGLVMWCLIGMTGACAPLIAAELGRRAHAVREIRRSTRMALWLGLAGGFVAMAIFAHGERLLLLAGQDPEVSRYAGRFMEILIWAALPNLAAGVLRTVVSALGRPFLATAITALAIVVNGIGNYAFVYGHFGAPAMGLDGSAVSSVLTACAMCAAYVAAIRIDRRLRRYHLLGHTIALQVAALAFQIPFGIGQAVTIRVGYHYGAADRLAIGRSARAALGLALAYMILPASLMIFAPRVVLGFYINLADPANAAMIGHAVRFLVIAAAFQLFDGAQAVLTGALRGLQDTRVPLLVALAGYWLFGFITSAALGFLTPLGGLGVWIGLAVGLVVVAALLGWRWRHRDRLGLLPA